MIKFSWKKINDKLDWNTFAVLEYFYFKQLNYIPLFCRPDIPYKVKHLASQPYPRGPCFILNINEVLEEADNPWHLYVYLELAAKRNLFDYKMRGSTHLPLALVPDRVLVSIQFNSMLEVKDDKLYFKYEQR